MPDLIGKILIRENAIDEATLDAALAQQASRRLGEHLIEAHGVPEETIYRCLAQQFSLPFSAAISDRVDRTLLRELPDQLLRQAKCLPLEIEGIRMVLAMGDPLDMDTIADIQLITGMVVDTVVTPPSAIAEFCTSLFESETMLRHSAGRISQEYERQAQRDEGTLSLEEIRKRTESEPVVKMVSLMFEEAIAMRASDIHIEPTEHDAMVRFRIDGLLHQHMELSRWMYTPVTSRIKIMANLDIAEKRVPQDGRIRHEGKTGNFDFRVSTLPTHWGEKTVIRILKHDINLLDLVNLGLAHHHLHTMEGLIRKPQGMIFVTGPTGSGKSSTLFACLNRIRQEAINITTIEDPIEYKLENVNQVQINEKAGVTFASTLRSILRQDPDVILVGEIRDRETAEIAIQASQTGHLVFSTLHTNDAVSAITRLRDLGIPPFMIASALQAILAQRLVRILCPHCRSEATPTAEMQHRWNAVVKSHELSKYYTAPGCKRCNQSGFLGRTGIFELVTIEEQLRGLVADNAAESTIRQELRRTGFRTILENGLEKVENGTTTPDELLRVATAEGIVV